MDNLSRCQQSVTRITHGAWSAWCITARTWDFRSDLDNFEEANGEPITARARRRLESAMEDWREVNPPEDDPIFDERRGEFHVNDVATLMHEYQRLSRLEERIMRALGPPSKRMRWDRKLGKFVDDESDCGD